MDLNTEAQALNQLPQRGEDTWQLAVVQFPPLVETDDDETDGPILGLCGSVETGRVRSSEVPEDTEASPVTLLLNALVGFAHDEDVNHRPGTLQVHDEQLADWLGEQLAPAGIQVEASPRLELIEKCLEQLMEQLVAASGAEEDLGVDEDQDDPSSDHGSDSA